MKTILEIEGTPNNEAASNEMVAKFGRFNGSSRLETVGREMRQLAMEPTALIVGGHEDLRGHMHGLLDQFGYRFFEAASAAETFTLLRSEIPIDTVFIVHHVREMDLGQLIQRLRANPVTSSVPIALLADSLSRGEHALADEDHRVVVGSVPPSIDGLTDIVARLRAVTDPPLLSQEARVIFKETAENFFQRVGSPPRNKAPHTGGTLLASSREEQNHLLRIATDASEAEAKRKQASQNFVQSVRRFGLLITTETAQEQYDVYNLRGESEPVTRAVMGRILDAIEASNGQRAWSEVSP
jgi:CheY-like chemotaxis protein